MLSQQYLIWTSRIFKMGGQLRDKITQISFSWSWQIVEPSHSPSLQVFPREIPCAWSAFCISNRELQVLLPITESKQTPWVVAYLGFSISAVFLFHSWSCLAKAYIHISQNPHSVVPFAVIGSYISPLITPERKPSYVVSKYFYYNSFVLPHLYAPSDAHSMSNIREKWKDVDNQS